MRVLSADDKKFLVQAYDYRVFMRTGEFHTPAANKLRSLERIYLQLQKINEQEPHEHEQRVLIVNRWFRPPIAVDAPALKTWKALTAEAQTIFDQAYLETKTFLDKLVYADRELLRELDTHRHRQEKERHEAEQMTQERVAVIKKDKRVACEEAAAALRAMRKWSNYEDTRVSRLKKEQGDFHDFLDKKDRRWRDTFN